MKRVCIIVVSICFVLLSVIPAFTNGKKESGPIKLVGATQVPKDHIYTRALVKFAGLVKKYYDGQVEIDVHSSGDLGGEKDFFEFMMEGSSVDFAIIAPSWIATWDKKAAFMDTPFLWKNVDQWNKALSSDVFKPIEDELKAMGVRVLGYAGGGVRNLILKKPIYKTKDLKGVLMRVMGSPIQARVFNATGIQATPMDYLEVYNAIKTGVVDGLENEASSLVTMKFYEVAPYIILTQHTITVRPFCFSETRFKTLPEKLQEAILKAGAEAAKWARDTESGNDWSTLQKLSKEGKIKLIKFDNSEMKARALPVIESYAKELKVEDILKRINNIQ
ncbi:MAG: TRAP transporter substrate-binding protein [Spirochaetes bacterium]|nr:TRAP transporter substrate-binding protein [Spirochaetota bacterium]